MSLDLYPTGAVLRVKEIDMSEYLKIENFAGIASLFIELSNINILIGPQATGKSVCAKLLYFFKSIPSELTDSIESPEILNTRLQEKFRQYFPLAYWPESGFKINYEINELRFEVSRPKGSRKLTIKLPEFYIGLLRKFSLEAQEEKRTALEEVKTPHSAFFIRRRMLKEIVSKADDTSAFPIFIPAGRSFFALLQSSIFSLLSANKEFDPFILEFGSFYEFIKDFRSSHPEEKSDSLIKCMLNGEFVRVEKEDFIKHDDGRKILLSHASSGQQEILPLILLLDSLRFRFNLGAAVFIEEPEAHIFPSAQRQVIELLAKTFNSRKNLQFVITTHSPYIITSLNNLIYASTLKKKLTGGQITKLHRIVSKDKIIDSEKVKAYSFGEGTCHSLTDPETGLLLTTVIDEVSDALSVQFGELLEASE